MIIKCFLKSSFLKLATKQVANAPGTKKKKKHSSSNPLLSNIDVTKNKEYSKEIGMIHKSCLPWFLICDNP